jgi:hypothetical protein
VDGRRCDARTAIMLSECQPTPVTPELRFCGIAAAISREPAGEIARHFYLGLLSALKLEAFHPGILDYPFGRSFSLAESLASGTILERFEAEKGASF